MANVCFTQYRITGNAEQLKSLYDLMLELQSMEKPFLNEICDEKKWLGNLVAKLGEDYTKYGCRGSWFELTLYDNEVVTFYTESAWYRCVDVENIIRDKFPDIDISFRCEECGCEIYETNDFSAFPEKFIIDDFVSGEQDYYLDEAEVIKRLSEVLEKDFNTFEEAMAAVKNHNENNEDYINVHEFKYSD